MRALTRSNSILVAISGTITSGTTGAPVRFPASTAASKIARAARRVRRIRVGAHLQLAYAISPAHQRGELTGERRLEHCDAAGEHLTGRAVDGDHIALLEAVPGSAHRLRRIVDAQRARARY